MKQICLQSRPVGLPNAETFEIKDVKLGGLHSGELHVKLVFLSVDPYLRGRMNDTKSYIPPFRLGSPITSSAVCKVIRSEARDFAPGDMVLAQVPWQEEVIVDSKKVQKVDTTIASAPAYLGVVGMTGLTAYFGLLEIGKPRKGETVVVSAAAGAVGSAVGQIAQIKGAYVVGIAGTDEKVNYLVKELGFNAALNYNDPDFPKKLKKACSKGVDIYFENVGGTISDAVWPLLNKNARIPVCGAISSYNIKPEEDMGPRVQTYLIKSSAMMQGFTVGNFQDEFPEGTRQLVKWLDEGKLTHKETIVEGFDEIIPAFLSLFDGKNIGKIVVKLD
ncbi:alcohol dehydrogenase [Listeria floridensis FSL S10-1187]|uniref:Alcohol dehydrogenase n=1 Tax=Listeria floridensis FSL S10-1187 TaxID=1265817 RepID=A0ABP3B007_9LIST|nr:NADP-dependent oxidoreductase [Listeria floridensis]EUJ33207.1 alcohol dehydrogenase [Listeria floridensis FSL S10-1187]